MESACLLNLGSNLPMLVTMDCVKSIKPNYFSFSVVILRIGLRRSQIIFYLMLVTAIVQSFLVSLNTFSDDDRSDKQFAMDIVCCLIMGGIKSSIGGNYLVVYIGIRASI